MSQTATNYPTNSPEMAAQEVLIALVNAGAFGCGENLVINNEAKSAAVAAAMIDIHTKLTAYYRSLDESQ